MKNNGHNNIALLLPLFYEFARQVREGVLDWANKNSRWRVIDLSLRKIQSGDSLGKHLHGAIYCPDPADSTGWQTLEQWNVPTVVFTQFLSPSLRLDRVANVYFDRESINKLAAQHFLELGFEVAGYVGSELMEGHRLAPRVADMKQTTLALGMEWVSHDLGKQDPESHPELLWEGASLQSLSEFLTSCPKPVGLLAQDDYIGVMLCEAAIDLGFSVPGQIAILGQGNRTIGHSGRSTLSSVILPGKEAGETSAELIRHWTNGRPPKSKSIKLPCKGIALRMSTGGVSRDPNIERAKRYLDVHFLRGVTVEELAAVSGYSTKTLRSKFADLHGLDVAKHSRNVRCEAIIRMLKETDSDIAEIGRQCGFESPSSFCNFLVRQTGLSPQQHRSTSERRVR